MTKVVFDAYNMYNERSDTLGIKSILRFFHKFLSFHQASKIDDIDCHSYAYHSSTLLMQIA
jgi:hypothetical protein